MHGCSYKHDSEHTPIDYCLIDERYGCLRSAAGSNKIQYFGFLVVVNASNRFLQVGGNPMLPGRQRVTHHFGIAEEVAGAANAPASAGQALRETDIGYARSCIKTIQAKRGRYPPNIFGLHGHY